MVEEEVEVVWVVRRWVVTKRAQQLYGSGKPWLVLDERTLQGARRDAFGACGFALHGLPVLR